MLRWVNLVPYLWFLPLGSLRVYHSYLVYLSWRRVVRSIWTYVIFLGWWYLPWHRAKLATLVKEGLWWNILLLLHSVYLLLLECVVLSKLGYDTPTFLFVSRKLVVRIRWLSSSIILHLFNLLLLILSLWLALKTLPGGSCFSLQNFLLIYFILHQNLNKVFLLAVCFFIDTCSIRGQKSDLCFGHVVMTRHLLLIIIVSVVLIWRAPTRMELTLF